MKNVLALAAVLFLTESLTQASILQSWVTTPTSVTTSTVNYDVQIWLLVVPDPALAAHKRLGNPMVPTLYAVASSGGKLRLLHTHQGEFVENPDAFLDALLRGLPARSETGKTRRGK